MSRPGSVTSTFMKSEIGGTVSQGIIGKFFLTFILLSICRLGTYVPLPGINFEIIDAIMSEKVGGILGMFNLFSGGALGRMTVFALNVMPYIVSSIVIQLLSYSIPYLNELRNLGNEGKRKLDCYTRYLTVFLCVLQGAFIVIGLENMHDNVNTIVMFPGWYFRVEAVSSLVAGTMLVLWLGERISSFGLGNGISLIIFSGIVSSLPSSVSSILKMSYDGSLNPIVCIVVLLIALGLLFIVVKIELSSRKISVHYPGRQLKNKFYSNSNVNHMPLKVNFAGVVPPIFSNALLMLPLTLLKFTDHADWSRILLSYFSPGTFLYVIFYGVLVIFFSFFYTALVFNPDELTANLRKSGGFIPMKRPGKMTADYLQSVVLRLTVFGSVYLALICIVPELVRYFYGIPFVIGGTGLLIVVNVIMDTVNHIKTSMFMNKYDSLLHKMKVRKV